MKTRIRLSHIALFLLLAGCTSMDDRATAGPAHAQAGKQVDTAYVAAVETRAARQGVRVRWVHPPTVETPDE